MLQALRDNAQGMVAKVIVFFIVIVFMLWGVESIVNLGGGSDSSYSVDGESISDIDIARLVEQQKANLRQQLGDRFNENMFNDQFFRSAAVNQLIEQRVALAAARSLGLSASKTEVDQGILAAPSFQVDGQFNKEQFKTILAMNGVSVGAFRRDLENNIVLQQMQSSLVLSNEPLPFQLTTAQALADETRRIRYIDFDVDSAKKDITLTDDDIQAYYTSHQDQYQTPAKAQIQYVDIDRSDLASTIDINDDELKQAYEDYRSRQLSQEQRQARHILLEVTSDRDDAATQALAKQLSDDIKNGASFSELVEQHSDDLASKEQAGDLGLLSQGDLDPDLSSAIFSLEENGVSKPIKTSFGYHVVQLQRIVKPTIESFEQQKEALSAAVRDEKAEFLYADKVQELENAAFSARTLEELSDATGLSVKQSDWFTRQQGDGVAKADAVRQMAFLDKHALDGELSELIESDGKALVFFVNERVGPAPKALSDVKDQVSDALSTERAREMVNQKADARMNDLAQGSWSNKVVTLSNAEGLNPLVLKRTFELPKGQSAQVSHSGGVTVVVVDDVTSVDWLTASATDASKQQISSGLARADIVAYQQWAKEQIEVVRPQSDE